jgi:hypothetical protein
MSQTLDDFQEVVPARATVDSELAPRGQLVFATGIAG